MNLVGNLSFCGSRLFKRIIPLFLGLMLFLCSSARSQSALEELRSLDPDILTVDLSVDPSSMLAGNLTERIAAVNRQSSDQWRGINDRDDWERFASERIESLRASLGEFPEVEGPPEFRVSSVLEGEGYQIQNLVFESRPGLWVTANLYLPSPPVSVMPAIILSHSHHNPKTQGELQDMGMTWARVGCAVLVPDHLGYGERRGHPFDSASDFEESYRVGRQDYYFRYNRGIQLHLVGESLMGWMVWDLMRAVDLLRNRTDIDPEKIAIMGAVAGGGDPVAVAAALDKRIAVTVPFNFGGPEPETTFPLPQDAETSFNYATSGSWESTRNLRLSCRDGFLPWVIVASIAPRHLIYAHEFSWDREHDPVWKRFVKIWGWYEVPERLDYTHGFGVLKQRPPDASHCNNIGTFHRRRIHAALSRWFGLSVSSEDDFQDRKEPEMLESMTVELSKELEPLETYEAVNEVGRERLGRLRDELGRYSKEEQRQYLRRKWREILGDVEPRSSIEITERSTEHHSHFHEEKVVLETESGIYVPTVILKPAGKRSVRAMVLCLSQGGKEAFLRRRTELIANLLERDMVVVLPDLRGTGETSPGPERGRTSRDTALSSSQLMLGDTIVGARLKDVRYLLNYLRNRDDLDSSRIAVWGDSFVDPNGTREQISVPLGLENQPNVSEPLGGMLALLTALFEDEVRAVYIRHGLLSFESALASPFVYLPHDVVVPGLFTAGDLPLLASVLAPLSLRIEAPVDCLNLRIPTAQMQQKFSAVLAAYNTRPGALFLSETFSSPIEFAAWLADAFPGD